MSLADEHLEHLDRAYREARRLAARDRTFVVVGMHPFIFMSGMPTHFNDSQGQPKAIETYVHLFSDRFAAARTAGWRLQEALEGLKVGPSQPFDLSSYQYFLEAYAIAPISTPAHPRPRKACHCSACEIGMPRSINTPSERSATQNRIDAARKPKARHQSTRVVTIRWSLVLNLSVTGRTGLLTVKLGGRR